MLYVPAIDCLTAGANESVCTCGTVCVIAEKITINFFLQFRIAKKFWLQNHFSEVHAVVAVVAFVAAAAFVAAFVAAVAVASFFP